MYIDPDNLWNLPYIACIMACLAVGAFAPRRSQAPIYALLVSALASLLFIVPSVGEQYWLPFHSMLDVAAGDLLKANGLSLASLVFARICRNQLLQSTVPHGESIVIDRSHALRSATSRTNVIA